MSIQFTTITITPLAGDPVTLPMPESVEHDQAGNVTFTFKDPLQDYRAGLAALTGRNCEQYRNRAGALMVIADAGAKLVTVAWSEVLPWDASLRAQNVTGVASLPSYQVRRGEEGFTLTLYKADALFERGSGVLTSA